MRALGAFLLPALPLLLLGGAAAGCGGETPSPDREASSTPAELPPSPAAASARAIDGPGRAARDILLITVDTLRADAVGFDGNPRATTPTVDRLAREGRVYDHAHAHNVVTLPSHANILTGRLPFEHGIRDNSGFVLPEELPTAATLLGEAGFATAAVVGAFPLDARFGLDRGFDLYDDRYPETGDATEFRLNERRGDEVVRLGREWWDRHEGERRFLWLHLYDPHAPYEPPEPFASRFSDDRYLGEVAAVDAFLAPLLGPILDGAGDPTLVIFTSDHGEGLGDHGEVTHGLFAYETTLRVPLVLWGPGIESDRTDTPARHVDLLPTLLDAADVPVPDGLPGRSLLRPLPPSAPPVTTYFEALSATLNRGWAPLRGVIGDGHKLIALPIPELYDLGADSAEAENLYDTDRPRARELARLLPSESTWPPTRRDVASDRSDQAAALRSLGYLSGAAPSKESYGPADDPKRLVHVDRKIHRFIDLYQRGRLAQATDVARELVRDRPEMGVAYYHLSQVLLERERPGEALEVLEAAARRGVATDAALRQLGLLLAQAGRSGEAISVLRPLAADGDPDTLNALGKVLAEGGRPDEAQAVLHRVFDRDPRNPEARQNLALVALQRQDWETARAEARAALDDAPGLAHAWNYLGVALYNLGRTGEALDAWERALVLDPENFDLLYNLGLVAAQHGEVERARTALDRFARGAPPGRYGPDIRKAREVLHQLERRDG